MPHHWGNILVTTKDELVPDYYSFDSLKQNIVRYKDKPYGIKKVQKGGNGRQMLIDFDSLPKEIQDSIGDPRKMKHPLIAFFQFDPAAVRYFSDFRFEDGTPLKQSFKEEYIANASVLIAAEKLRIARLTEWKKLGKTNGRGLLPSICQDITTFNEYMPKLFSTSHTIPASYRAFDRIWKPFFNSFDDNVNYGSLISGKLRNKNRKLMTDEMIELLNDMFGGQEHKPSRTEVASQYKAFLKGELIIINTETAEEYDHTDTVKFKEMSDSSIIAWLGKWEYKIGTYAKRSGDRQKLMDEFTPWHKLSKIKEAGTLISIDDRQPPFIYDDKKNRAWFYMGIDVGSEAWTCWVWGKEKKSIIINFYRQMVRNYTEWGFNLPLGLECESSLNSSIKSANPFLQLLTSLSKTAVWKNIFEAVGFVIFNFQEAANLHLKEIDDKIAAQKVPNERWYREQALRFQYGFELNPESYLGEFLPTYEDANGNIIEATDEEIENSKIIQYASVTANISGNGIKKYQ